MAVNRNTKAIEEKNLCIQAEALCIDEQNGEMLFVFLLGLWLVKKKNLIRKYERK